MGRLGKAVRHAHLAWLTIRSLGMAMWHGLLGWWATRLLGMAVRHAYLAWFEKQSYLAWLFGMLVSLGWKTELFDVAGWHACSAWLGI